MRVIRVARVRPQLLALSAPGGWLGGLTGSQDISWAVQIVEAGRLVVVDSVVRANEAASGGGVSASAAADVVLDGCLLVGNSAAGSGGGIALTEAAAVSINGTAVEGNSAGADGGGLAVFDAAIAAATAAAFRGNVAGGCGGAVSTASAQPMLLAGAVALTFNRAGGAGGALCLLPLLPSNISCPASESPGMVAGVIGQAVLDEGAVVTAQNNFAQGGGGGIFFGCAGPPGPARSALAGGRSGRDGWVLLNNTAGYGEAVASMPFSLVIPRSFGRASQFFKSPCQVPRPRFRLVSRGRRLAESAACPL